MEAGEAECAEHFLEENHGDIFFSPPLFLQRYKFVADSAIEYAATSLLDIGCAECVMMRFLPDVKSLKRIGLLDQDENLLQENKLRIKPGLHRFVEKRENPLRVQLYHGNAALLDKRMQGFDVVTMVEFIEHLHYKDLQNVLHAVFKGINPRIVIVTTPNFEFNVLFEKKGQSNFKLRHSDHKFEWTRSQFQEWGAYMCSSYGYKVRYDGVGSPPLGKEFVGFCTQIAVFERIDGCQCNVPSPPVFENVYTLIEECDYPYQRESGNFKTKMKIEVEYYLRSKLRGDKYLDDAAEKVFVPLDEIFQYKPVEKLCEGNIAILRNFMMNDGYELTSVGSVAIPLEEYRPHHICLEEEEMEDETESLYQHVKRCRKS